MSLSGIGLHTGEECNLTLYPTDENTGIVFVRTDLDKKPMVKADVNNVIGTNRGTVLKQNDAKVHTVEHLLSALFGLGIDNAKVEISGPEPPVLEGSALPYIKAINASGINKQSEPKNIYMVEEPIRYKVNAKDIEINILPYDDFKITFIMDYGIKGLGVQYSSVESVSSGYVEGIAPARTFGLLSEITYLLNNDLIKGGSLDNSVVFVDQELSIQEQEFLMDKYGKTIKLDFKKGSILNTEGLRFENEPVRHKVLDLIGDLALFGRPIYGHVIAKKSGHGANIELVKELRKVTT